MILHHESRSCNILCLDTDWRIKEAKIGKDTQQTRYITATFNKSTSTFLRPKRYHPQIPSNSCNLNPGWGAAWGRWAFVWPPLIPDQRAPRKASRWCHDVPQGIDNLIYQCKMSSSFEGLRGCYSSEISRWVCRYELFIYPFQCL